MNDHETGTAAADTPRRSAEEVASLRRRIAELEASDSRLRGRLEALEGESHRRLEEARRELERVEASMRAFANAVPDIAFVLDGDGRYLEALSLPQTQDLLYSTVESLKGRLLHEVLPAASADLFLSVVRRTLETGEPQTLEYVLEVQAGERWFEGRTAIVEGLSERPLVLWVSRDISEAKRREEQLRRSQRQLRALGARLVEAQEEEKARLSRELHDQIGQTLTALGINLGVLREALGDRVPPTLLERLDEAAGQVEQTTERIRGVLSELRPAVLDDCGLLAALRWVGQRVEKRAGIAVRVEGTELEPTLPPAQETALFRIAQEALTNAVKHSGASQVTVRLESTADGARLSLVDDGAGFDPAAAADQSPGWGLLIMSERAALADAALHIDSEPGAGTRVLVELKTGG